MSEAKSTDINAAALAELAGVKGQLQLITQLITQHHAATHQRIDDMRHSVETRLTGIETRLSKVESNERGTAMRTAGISALSGALVAAAFEVVRRQGGH